jgi:DNA ligase-associated metallophosphoesterase
MKDLPFTSAGLDLELCPERAAFVPQRRELLLADVHLGKAAAFRRAGKPLPRGTTLAELARIDALVERKGAERLTILGDLFHAAVDVASPTARAFRGWLERRSQTLEITLVRGNHDRHARELIADLPLTAVPEPLTPPSSPLDYRHHPVEDRAVPDRTIPDRLGGNRPWIAGHLHPGVRMSDGADGLRLPVFWQSAGGLVLPAFGRFTGLQIIEPRPGDRVAAVTPTAVVALPGTAFLGSGGR